MSETLLTNGNEIAPSSPDPLFDAAGPELSLHPEDEDNASPYAAFKCFFFTPKRGDIAGAFCLIFDGASGKALFQNFWVTRTDNIPSLRATQDWRDFNRALSQMGPFDKVLGDKLFPSLPELLTPADCAELFANIDSRKIQNLTLERVRKHFERTTHYFLEMSCELQLLTRQDLIEAKILNDPSENRSERDSAGEEETSFAGTLIQCLPVIDPVRGKALSDLKPGDLLEVQVKHDAGAGGLIQQFMNATNHPSIFPVESIEKRDDEKTYVYLTISEEIQGLLTLTKDLRLKTKQPPPNPFQNLKIENVVFVGTLIVALLVVLVAVRYLFF